MGPLGCWPFSILETVAWSQPRYSAIRPWLHLRSTRSFLGSKRLVFVVTAATINAYRVISMRFAFMLSMPLAWRFAANWQNHGCE